MATIGLYDPISIPYNYKFGDKELQETGFYDFGARNYMPDVGRWFNIDPMAELAPDLSPFRFAFNNPVSFTDPDGMYENGYGGGDYYDDSDRNQFNGIFEINPHWTGPSRSHGESSDLLDAILLRWSPGIDIRSGWHDSSASQSDFAQDMAMENSSADDGPGPKKPIPTISQWDGDRGFFGNWANSDNLLAQLAYGTVNNVYLTAQTLDTFNWLGAKNQNNVYGTLAYSNLDGSRQYNSGDRAVAFATTALPLLLKGINASFKIPLQKSVSSVMGKGYSARDEVTVPIKNTKLLNELNLSSKGDWVKVYEAGIKNGNKMEVHYFRNNTTGKVFDVKTKYQYWHQKAFKNL